MNFDQIARKVCEDRGLELLSTVSEGWYFFVKNSEGRVFPVPESRLAAWVQEEVDKRKEKVKESYDKAVEQNGVALKRLGEEK